MLTSLACLNTESISYSAYKHVDTRKLGYYTCEAKALSCKSRKHCYKGSCSKASIQHLRLVQPALISHQPHFNLS